MLPFIEQDNLYKQLDLMKPIDDPKKPDIGDAKNRVHVRDLILPDTANDAPTLPVATFVVHDVSHALIAARLSAEYAIGVRHGCFCANPYVFHLLHMSKADVATVEGEVTAGRRKALPGAVRASLAPYNTEAETDRFLEAVRQVARGRIKATYVQAADGTYAPSGGWPRIPTALHAVVKH